MHECTDPLWNSLRRSLMSLACTVALMPACASEPEVSNQLVAITNVRLARPNTATLTVALDYELEPGRKLPLPYDEILVFPIEPNVKLAGTLEPFFLSAGSVTVQLPVPAEVKIDWQTVSDVEHCCLVSLKGLRTPTGGEPRYERISNQVRVPPPRLADQ